MLIPYYWAECRLQKKSRSKSVTVKRWGWSDVSQQEAQELADRRAQEAIEKIQSGEKLHRQEPKDSYGSAGGVPIREEVVSRHGDIAITRNSYGSLCLNTPNVFFADVDMEVPSLSHHSMIFLPVVFLVSWLTYFTSRSLILGGGALLALLLVRALLNKSQNQKQKVLVEEANAKRKEKKLDEIRLFSSQHPDWHLRVYETPAGYRLLAMHDVYDPRSDLTKASLKELNSDERFSTLCALQACFRARVSPKYWRAGYKPTNSLTKSKWPFPSEHIPKRQTWIAGYDAIACQFASCRFVERLGSDATHPDAEKVRDLHDQLCQTHTSLPLA